MLGIALVSSLFLFRLGSLVPAASPNEIQSRSSASSLHVILKDPVNGPYKLLRYVALTIHRSIIMERLPSAIIVGISVILFYKLARRFGNKQAALLGTLLYATSSAALNNGRLAMPTSMLILPLALLSCGAALRFNKHHIRYWIITAVVVAIAFYTPGMLYFVLAAIAAGLWHIRKKKILLPKPIILGMSALLLVLLLVPLFEGFVSNPGIWREYFGIPVIIPNIMGFIKNLVSVPLGLFIKAPFNPTYRLGKLPLLDIFASFLFVIGCFTTIRHYRLDRLYLFGGALFIGTLFVALSGNYENSFVIVPFVYLLATVGINFLLSSWRTVFPLNPLAHTLSVSVLSVAVLISCNFQTRRYLVAWPHNPATKAVFTEK